MDFKTSLFWFLIIMGVYGLSCTIIAYGIKVLYDICTDLYRLWESRKK